MDFLGFKHLGFPIFQTSINEVGNILHMEQAGIYGGHNNCSQWLTILKNGFGVKTQPKPIKAELYLLNRE